MGNPLNLGKNKIGWAGRAERRGEGGELHRQKKKKERINSSVHQRSGVKCTHAKKKKRTDKRDLKKNGGKAENTVTFQSEGFTRNEGFARKKNQVLYMGILPKGGGGGHRKGMGKTFATQAAKSKGGGVN